jgi:hypothetical protein
VLALAAYHDRAGDPRSLPLAESLLAGLLPLYAAGRFRIHADSSVTYVHAHCYAVEGLLCLQRRGLAEVGGVARDCAGWLAQIQAANGGIRAWHDGTHASGPLRADATAQAVRIWSCVNRRAFGDAIGRALGFLGRLQSVSGGICYEPGSGDVNTWATVFAVQAVRWAAEGGDDRLVA